MRVCTKREKQQDGVRLGLGGLDAVDARGLCGNQTVSRVHAETRRENLIYAQLEAAGAALRAMCFPPLLHLDVGPLGTLDIRVPPA